MNAIRTWMADLLKSEPPVPRIHTEDDTLPVPAFGALAPGVETATLARNPSFDEVRQKKIPVLSDFKVVAPTELTSDHLAQIESKLSTYFVQPGGPTEFFRKLNPVVAAAGRSYEAGSAVHLDLSPWPNVKEWSKLKPEVKKELLVDGLVRLVEQLKLGDINLLLVNGFASYSDLRLAFGLAGSKGLKLGEVRRVPFETNQPLMETEMILFDPGGERRIQLCYWHPFICARHHGGTAEIELALRTRFSALRVGRPLRA